MEHDEHDALAEHTHVAVVETVLDYRLAWRLGRPPRMSEAEEAKAWSEIRNACRTLVSSCPAPAIVLLPELAVPRSRVRDLERISRQLKAVVIAGLDYRVGRTDTAPRPAWNEAVAIIPDNIGEPGMARSHRTIRLGKCDAAPGEAKKLADAKCEFRRSPAMFLLHGGRWGTMGIAICSDVLDPERVMVYAGRIDHLVVLAYNRDVRLFSDIAHTLAYTLFCNAVICNTGHYGGSIAVSPFRDSHRRVLYRREGPGPGIHVVALPVRDLRSARRGRDADGVFKTPPPRVQQYASRQSEP